MAKQTGQEKESKAVSAWDPFADLAPFGRWLPFRGLAERGRLGRMMEELMGEHGLGRGDLAPAIDIHESDSEFIATVELPGVKREDVTVELNEGVITVTGEKKSEREEKKERGRWIERSYGTFSRSFSLPANAASDQIDASFKDGVLTLRIARLEQSKPTTIRVK